MRQSLVILVLVVANCFLQAGHSGQHLFCEAASAAELAIDDGLARLQPVEDTPAPE